MPEPIQVVIDTNVLLGALRSQRGASYCLLQDLQSSRWKANVSVPLAFEYEEVARRERLRLEIPDADVEALLKNIIRWATPRVVAFKWPLMTGDRDDEMVLELAVAARAEYLITFNTRNFLEARKFGIRVVKPGEFLNILRA